MQSGTSCPCLQFPLGIAWSIITEIVVTAAHAPHDNHIFRMCS